MWVSLDIWGLLHLFFIFCGMRTWCRIALVQNPFAVATLSLPNKNHPLFFATSIHPGICPNDSKSNYPSSTESDNQRHLLHAQLLNSSIIFFLRHVPHHHQIFVSPNSQFISHSCNINMWEHGLLRTQPPKWPSPFSSAYFEDHFQLMVQPQVSVAFLFLLIHHRDLMKLHQFKTSSKLLTLFHLRCRSWSTHRFVLGPVVLLAASNGSGSTRSNLVSITRVHSSSVHGSSILLGSSVMGTLVVWSGCNNVCVCWAARVSCRNLGCGVDHAPTAVLHNSWYKKWVRQVYSKLMYIHTLAVC